MEKKELVTWVKEQIAIRSVLSNHCTLNGVSLAYDCNCKDSILLYDESVFRTIAKAFKKKVKCVEISESSVFNYEWHITIDGVIITAYSMKKYEEEK